MNAPYEDITIVDLDLKKTTWSRVHSSMRTLYLKLSREPEIDWVRFFNEERESRVVQTRHGLWIEDGYIVFDCLLRNVETLHLPDFRLSIAYANEHSRLRRVQKREEIEQLRVEENDERDLLSTLQTRLRDDAPSSNNVLPKTTDIAAIIDSSPAALADSTEPPAIAERIEPSVPASPAANDNADFDARRDEWRAQFRNALNGRNGSGRDKS